MIYFVAHWEDVKVGKLSSYGKIITPTFILFVQKTKDEVYFKDFAWQGGNVFKFEIVFALYQEKH
jgi:hypothetical protein